MSTKAPDEGVAVRAFARITVMFDLDGLQCKLYGTCPCSRRLVRRFQMPSPRFGASSNASIRFGLILRSRSPPPRERMSSASLSFARLVLSQAAKTPSSFVRAVNSETCRWGRRPRCRTACGSRSPAATVALYLYWKPRQILIAFGRLLGDVKIQAWLLALLGASIMAVAFAMSQPKSALAELKTILLLATTAILFSTLPNLWAYAAYHAVADSLLSIFIFGVFGLWATGVVLIERWRSRAASPVESRRDSGVE
jgi:hypothetical protein